MQCVVKKNLHFDTSIVRETLVILRRLSQRIKCREIKAKLIINLCCYGFQKSFRSTFLHTLSLSAGLGLLHPKERHRFFEGADLTRHLRRSDTKRLVF